MKRHWVFLLLFGVLPSACGRWTLAVPLSTTPGTIPTGSPILLPALEATLTASPIIATAVSTAAARAGELHGRLFLWHGFRADLGVVEPVVGGKVNLLEPAASRALGPRHAISLAFSEYSQQVAYVTALDRLEIWVADVALRQTESVWADTEHWLGEPSEAEAIDILWGPNDKSVMLVGRGSNPRGIAHSLITGRAVRLTGACNQVAVSPVSKRFALWCQSYDDQPNFSVLDWDGAIWDATAPPEGFFLSTTEWAFSPDGNEVLYVSDRTILALADSNGTQVDLPVTYTRNAWEIRSNMHWSRDSSRIAVYGYAQGLDACPKFLNPETNRRQDRPCWQVFDPTTRSRIWWPRDDLAEALHSSWDRLNATDYEAALSPDGQWLAMSLRASGIRHLVVTSVTESQMLLVGNFDALRLSWGD